MNPCDDVWKNEKAFFNWLRSQTRRIWNRHPVKTEYKKSRRYKAPVGINGKDVWVSDCEMCGKQSRNCQVDHIVEGGSFNDWESYTEWAKRILLVGFDDIRELCPDCHADVTYAQRSGLSLEEAKIERKVAALKSRKVSEIKTTLDMHGISWEHGDKKADLLNRYRDYIRKAEDE